MTHSVAHSRTHAYKHLRARALAPQPLTHESLTRMDTVYLDAIYLSRTHESLTRMDTVYLDVLKSKMSSSTVASSAPPSDSSQRAEWASWYLPNE